MEVWRGNERVGGAAEEGLLGGWAQHRDGCQVATLAGAWYRVCAITPADLSLKIIAASPLKPLLGDLLPLFFAVSGVALAMAAIFSLVSRRLARRSLLPLARFEQRVAELPALGHGRGVETSWGAAEIDTLAQTFNALLVRTDAALKREQRFVADAAHELRTPLTRLRGQIELVLAELPGQPDASARLTRAARTCEELTRTTEALLALARNQCSTDETVDLEEVVQRVFSGVPRDERERLHSLCAEAALVRGDEALLVLAVVNLIDNALKYSPGRVLVRLQSRDGSCVLLVEDSGSGIAADELSRVRQPFVRGRAHASAVRGTGLGLTLVEHVATVHRGTLQLTNLQPQGFCAELRLPTWEPRKSADDKPPPLLSGH
jgi:signal transduction histidine kinase